MSNGIGCEAYRWFVAMAFAKDGFAEHVEEKGIDQVMRFECPYQDIGVKRYEHLKAVFNCPELREIHQLWWDTYNRPDVRAQLPVIVGPEAEPWMP